MLRRNDDQDRRAEGAAGEEAEETYGVVALALALDCQVATIRRHLKSGSLPSNGTGLCTARQLQRFMSYRGMGSVQLRIVERLLEVASATPSHAPAVKRVGRPRLPAAELRSVVLRTRLTEAEHAEIVKRANDARLSVSAFSRVVLTATRSKD